LISARQDKMTGYRVRVRVRIKVRARARISEG
jgi:hypothetical protein